MQHTNVVWIPHGKKNFYHENTLKFIFAAGREKMLQQLPDEKKKTRTECREQQVKRKPCDDHRSNLIYWCNQEGEKNQHSPQIQGNSCLVDSICHLVLSATQPVIQTSIQIECLIESPPIRLLLLCSPSLYSIGLW